MKWRIDLISLGISADQLESRSCVKNIQYFNSNCRIHFSHYSRQNWVLYKKIKLAAFNLGLTRIFQHESCNNVKIYVLT